MRRSTKPGATGSSLSGWKTLSPTRPHSSSKLTNAMEVPVRKQSLRELAVVGGWLNKRSEMFDRDLLLRDGLPDTRKIFDLVNRIHLLHCGRGDIVQAKVA